MADPAEPPIFVENRDAEKFNRGPCALVGTGRAAPLSTGRASPVTRTVFPSPNTDLSSHSVVEA